MGDAVVVAGYGCLCWHSVSSKGCNSRVQGSRNCRRKLWTRGWCLQLVNASRAGPLAGNPRGLSVCLPTCLPGVHDWLMLALLSTRSLIPLGPGTGIEKHPHCPPLAVLEGCCCSLSGAQVQERRGESCPSLSLPTTWQDREEAVQPFLLALGHRSPSPCAGQANSLACLPAGAASHQEQLTEQISSPTPSVDSADKLNSGLIVAFCAALSQAQARCSVVK